KAEALLCRDAIGIADTLPDDVAHLARPEVADDRAAAAVEAIGAVVGVPALRDFDHHVGRHFGRADAAAWSHGVDLHRRDPAGDAIDGDLGFFRLWPLVVAWAQ